MICFQYSKSWLPNYFLVGTSKASSEAVTKYWTVELAKKSISVNAIWAGIVETEALNSFPNKDEMLNSKKQNPVGRSVNTVDIANLVLFLCTQKSEMIRGQTIVLDGGYNLTT